MGVNARGSSEGTGAGRSEAAWATASASATIGGGIRDGCVLSGKSSDSVCASASVAPCTPWCCPLTSWSSAKVWLTSPSAAFTLDLPSGSEEARSASKSAPTACAMFCVTAITSGGMFESSWSAPSALLRFSRACRAVAEPE